MTRTLTGLLFALYSAVALANKSIPLPLAINGGESVKANDPVVFSTVAIGKSDRKRIHCTATLIAEDILLTAAHCLTEGTDTIYFGTQTLQPVKKVSIHSYRLHPYYNTKVSKETNDIALIYFEGGLPENYKPASLPPADYRPSVGTDLIVAGYGADLAQNLLGVLKKTVIEVMNPHYSPKEFQSRQDSTNGVCFGDSGGPAYVYGENGELIVIGVANFVGNRQCGKYVVHEAPGGHYEWLGESIRSLRSGSR